jgi:hypothetical protein
LWLRALDTKGNDLNARILHSMTLSLAFSLDVSDVFLIICETFGYGKKLVTNVTNVIITTRRQTECKLSLKSSHIM